MKVLENKLLYVVLLITLIGNKSFAQKYSAGVVYNDTILKGKITGQNGDCFNTIEVSDSLLNYITGLNLSIQIINIKNTDSINVYNGITLASYGVLKVGDTLPISSKRTKYNFTFSGYNIFDFALLASGTPTITNESYYCNLKWSSNRAIAYDCGGFSTFNIKPDSLYVKNCKIANITTGLWDNQYIESNIKITPNPVSNYIYIKLNNEHYSYQVNIYDLSGKLVLTNLLTGNCNTEISTAMLKDGFYLYQVSINDAILGQGKLSIIR